jgi:hypothetical protein
MHDKTEINKETEVLTSGGTTIEIQRGLKHTRIELNILHQADDDQLSSEELLSRIRNVFKAPHPGSQRWETLGLKIYLTHKLLDKIKATFMAVEVDDETNDSDLLKNFSWELNECSRIVLPILAFDLDAYRLEVESILKCIHQDNEPENEPHQIDPLPVIPAQPVSPRAVSPGTSNTNPPQNSGNGQNGKSDKSRTQLSPRLTERLKAFNKSEFTGTNRLRTEIPSIKP